MTTGTNNVHVGVRLNARSAATIIRLTARDCVLSCCCNSSRTALLPHPLSCSLLLDQPSCAVTSWVILHGAFLVVGTWWSAAGSRRLSGDERACECRQPSSAYCDRMLERGLVLPVYVGIAIVAADSSDVNLGMVV